MVEFHVNDPKFAAWLHEKADSARTPIPCCCWPTEEAVLEYKFLMNCDPNRTSVNEAAKQVLKHLKCAALRLTLTVITESQTKKELYWAIISLPLALEDQAKAILDKAGIIHRNKPKDSPYAKEPHLWIRLENIGSRTSVSLETFIADSCRLPSPEKITISRQGINQVAHLGFTTGQHRKDFIDQSKKSKLWMKQTFKMIPLANSSNSQNSGLKSLLFNDDDDEGANSDTSTASTIISLKDGSKVLFNRDGANPTKLIANRIPRTKKGGRRKTTPATIDLDDLSTADEADHQPAHTNAVKPALQLNPFAQTSRNKKKQNSPPAEPTSDILSQAEIIQELREHILASKKKDDMIMDLKQQVKDLIENNEDRIKRAIKETLKKSALERTANAVLPPNSPDSMSPPYKKHRNVPTSHISNQNNNTFIIVEEDEEDEENDDDEDEDEEDDDGDDSENDENTGNRSNSMDINDTKQPGTQEEHMSQDAADSRNSSDYE